MGSALDIRSISVVPVRHLRRAAIDLILKGVNS